MRPSASWSAGPGDNAASAACCAGPFAKAVRRGIIAATDLHEQQVMEWRMIRQAIGVAVLAGALASCGTTSGDRTLSGAGVGAGVGMLAGPVGAAVGAVAGAAVGYSTDKEDIYLGKPVWKDK
jgi:hypothetical protein